MYIIAQVKDESATANSSLLAFIDGEKSRYELAFALLVKSIANSAGAVTKVRTPWRHSRQLFKHSDVIIQQLLMGLRSSQS
jgi:hypothetical protein